MSKAEKTPESVNILFEDNKLLPILFGNQDAHLAQIEKKLNVSTSSRGNMLAISGEARAVEISKKIIEGLYTRVQKGEDVTMSEVDAAIRLASEPKVSKKRQRAIEEYGEDVVIKTLKKNVAPYSHKQAEYIRALLNHDLVFALGPAGTGKTYLAVAQAVSMFVNRKVERIILSRPAVEAGEKLGFLPGDLKEKIDPYLRPLYDALYDMIPGDKVLKLIESGEIEVAPLAFMRGRTLSNAFIILDEAQNTTPTQMKMFLTRLGENSRMVVTGDLSQIDLPKDIKSGLRDAVNKLSNVEGIAMTSFSDLDVVRHDLAAKIVQIYEEWDKKKKNGNGNN